MKKAVLIMGITLLIIFSLNSIGLAKMVINTNRLDEGIITVTSTSELTKKVKVRIIKDDKEVTYDFSKSNEEVPYALTFGNGTYEVKVFENVVDNKYKVVTSKSSIKLELKDEKEVFLNQTEEVNWNEEQRYIKLAKELTKDAKTDLEKVELIYDYLTKNFKYDYSKIYGLESSYRPNLETLYDEMTGICYDYSAIFAGMLRSLGIPTKLVKGYSVQDMSTYHAWNSVLVDGEWKMVDTTNDAYRVQNNINVDMFKSDDSFIVSYEY